ncbi:MAG: tetratricopeptide repeat protein [Verrucomicrobiota bacterium]
MQVAPTHPPGVSPQQRLRLVCAALIFGTLFLYGPVRLHEFVGFDDYNYVVSNERVRAGLSWDNLVWAFTSSHFHMWHPLTTLSHMLDCQLFGLNAGAHHLVNVFLHAFSAALLFLALHRLTGAGWRCAVIAALFAWHPLRVESVAWVAERKDVLCGFFGVLTIWAYAGNVLNPSRRGYALTLAAFAGALMSKPMAVTLPFVLLLLDFWPLKRFDEHAGRSLLRLAREKALFFVLVAVVSGVTFAAQAGGGVVVATSDVSVAARLANVPVAYARYLANLFWPVDLAVLYPHEAWQTWQVLGATLLVLAICAAVLRRTRAQPWLFTGWFWFLGMLVPVIGIVQVGPQSMADRYTYLPSIGIALLFVWQMAEWGAARRVPMPLRAALAAGAVVALVLATRGQLPAWRNTLALFEHAARVTRNNAAAHLNVGQQLEELGRTAEARARFERALEINPRAEEALYNLGLIHFRERDWKRAADYFTRAAQVNPFRAETYIQLGSIQLAEGQPAEALGFFQRAVELSPRSFEGHHNLGVTFSQSGRLDLAVRHFLQAVEINPNAPTTRIGLGFALAKLTRLPEAEQQFREALRLQPGALEVSRTLGSILFAQGRLDEAATFLQQSLQANPKDAAAHLELGRLRWRQHQHIAALDHFQAAAQLRPDWPPALDRLAWALATSPDASLRNGAQAVQLAERVVQSLRVPEALDTLAAAHAESGRFGEAVTAAQSALQLAQETGRADLIPPITQRLELYREGKPFREGK